MRLTIQPVSSRRDLRRFIDLPPRLYQGIAGYEAPMRMDRVMLLDPRKSGFFERGQAQYWLALRDGTPVGRISAQIGPDQPVGVPAKTGMFGCLDTIDDERVVAALITEAEQWLARRGCRYAMGPMLLDMNGEPGLMIEGFDQGAMTVSPWHPPYLQAHVEAQGYEKWRDLQSWRLDRQSYTSAEPRKSRRPRKHRGFTMRPMTRRSMARDIETMVELFNDGWRDNWGFIPLPLKDLQHLIKTLSFFLPPGAGKVVEVDGAPAAVLLIIPNMFELTAGFGPKPSPVGWLRLGLRALSFRPKEMRVIILGLSSELKSSIYGGAIVLALIEEIVAQAKRLKLDRLEAGWILENNDALIKIIAHYGFFHNKTFRIFGKRLG